MDRAKADIELLVSKLLLQGKSAAAFDPAGNVTRAEFAAMLARALGLSPVRSTAFADVGPNDWFAGAVGASVKAGLVGGISDNLFAPNDPVTRQQMVVMIARAIRVAGKTVKTDGTAALAPFADRSVIAPWAQTAAAEAVASGIIRGTNETSFSPETLANRAQAAVMLKRFLQYVNFMN